MSYDGYVHGSYTYTVYDRTKIKNALFIISKVHENIYRYLYAFLLLPMNE